MTIETPEFQGTHLWDRLCWAKEKLEPYRTEYCVVWEDPETPDEPAKITHPDPNWMACALKGGILPPVEAYWELKKDEEKPDFVKHTRGYLLHNTKPIEAMTEERAIEYLIMKDLPRHVWQDYDKANKPRMLICTKSQLPSTRVWRNAWKINEDINTTHNEEAALKEKPMATTNIVDKDGNSISASDATVPSDRHFRGAWSLSGTTISEDLAVAKTIFKDKVREVRKPLLDAEDVVYMKAMEADDADAKAASVTKKTNLRNAPAASAITSASSITALKAAWDADLLGDSPYA